MKGLKPILDGIEVLGDSSDHVVVDITKSKVTIRVGNTIEFKLNYSTMLRAMTSMYIHKVYLW